MNVPYKKRFEKDGRLQNPIIKEFINRFPNRRERRKENQKFRFYGESKNYSLTVNGVGKYKRVKQFEKDKKGNAKVIEHYILQ